MAIFHYHIKIVGRSKGKSCVSSSAYINGAKMKDLETGRTFSYEKKKEIVYSALFLCENAPPEWGQMDVKEAKEHLWNEVLKVEKTSNAQLARSLEFALPKEWSRQEQIDYASEYIRENFVSKGMCADWVIHDKGNGNPHVHCLLTMRPFKEDHTWGAKEKKAYLLDENGERIPVIDPKTGQQKLGKRNAKVWKRGVVDSTGWNNSKNCTAWRKAWADKCNAHLKEEERIDHRSHAERGIIDIPTIHVGADAAKIQEHYEMGISDTPSWKAEKNNQIKQQNAFLHKLLEAFRGIADKIKEWRNLLDDLRRKQLDSSDYGRNDTGIRGTTDIGRGLISATDTSKRATDDRAGAEPIAPMLKQTVQRIAGRFAILRGNATDHGTGDERKCRSDEIQRRLDELSGEAVSRESEIKGTEQFLADADRQLQKRRKLNERYSDLLQRRRTAHSDGRDADRNRDERSDDFKTYGVQPEMAGESKQLVAGTGERKPESIKERLAKLQREMEARESVKEESRKPGRGRSR